LKKYELLMRAVWNTRLPNDPLEVDVTNNKPALLIFCALIVASAVIWISLAVAMA
jgi:hypothetical protein